MDSLTKWNYIVERYSLLYNSQESIIQKEWENYFSELFDYKKLFGEIDSQRSITIGSGQKVIPDIILKKNGKDLIDIELKQYNLVFESKMEEQLKSYLKLLNLSIGVIICHKIFFCYFDYSANKLYKVVIDFVKDNKDGAVFIDLLTKSVFNENMIKDFIQKKLEAKQKIAEIQNIVNEELISNLLKDYLRKQYTEEEINIALKDYEVKIVKNSWELNNSREFNAPTVKIDPVKSKEVSFSEDANFPLTPNYIIIKTSYARVNACGGNLYDATRHCWRVKFDTVNKYPYVLAVIEGVVKEAYKVKRWQKAEKWDNDGNVDGRLEFVGEIAEEEIRKSFIGKTIPAKYRKPGMASPVIYSK